MKYDLFSKKKPASLLVLLAIKLVALSQPADPANAIKYFVQTDVEAKKIVITIDLRQIEKQVCLQDVNCTLQYLTQNNQSVATKQVSFSAGSRNVLSQGDVYKLKLPLSVENAYKARGGKLTYRYFECAKADDAKDPSAGGTEAKAAAEFVKDEPDPLLQPIVGEWRFHFKSTISGAIHTGTVLLEANEIEGRRELKGKLIDDSPYNSISGNVTGTFDGRQLVLQRETGVKNIKQKYKVKYLSKTKCTGSFENINAREAGYKDKGSFELSRAYNTDMKTRVVHNP